MKKSIIGTVALGALVTTLVTGCGAEKKLVCTQSVSGVDVTFNITFSGDKLKAMDLAYDMDLSKYSDSQVEAVGKQDFCSLVKTQMSQYSSAFKNCKQDISNKTLNIKADFDVKELADDNDLSGGPEAAKKGLESAGYTCK